MNTTYKKMKYFCVIIVLNCLIDTSFVIQVTTPIGNVKFFESYEQLLIRNQTDASNDSNKTSVTYTYEEVTTTPRSENATGTYVPELKKEAFSVQHGWENNTRVEERIAVDTHYNDFGVTELAGIACVCVLVIAVFGYFGFVYLRKYLVNKYGNGQTLITEEEYDTSDLRNFTI